MCAGHGRDSTSNEGQGDGGGGQEHEEGASHQTHRHHANIQPSNSNPRCTLAVSQAILRSENGRITMQPYAHTDAARGYSHGANPDRGIGSRITTRSEIRREEDDRRDGEGAGDRSRADADIDGRDDGGARIGATDYGEGDGDMSRCNADAPSRPPPPPPPSP